jgi:hypothetical protein
MFIFSNPKVHAGNTKGGPGTPRNGWLWDMLQIIPVNRYHNPE